MLHTPLAPSPVGKLAFSYVRMSTAQQMHGDSLRRQLAASKAYAEEHGLILDDTLRDIGVSAWAGRNSRDGALAHFIELVNLGRIPAGSYLIVESLDRISRDQVVNALQLFLQILQSGITIVTLMDRQVYSRQSVGENFSQLLISLTIMQRAHEESQTKSVRIKAAVRRRGERAQQGKASFTHNTPAWIDRHGSIQEGYTFTLNSHAHTVKRIFEMTADGIGQRTIARMFNEEPVPTFTAKADGWHSGTLAIILASETARGRFTPMRTNEDGTRTQLDTIEGYYPAVISEELWQRAHNTKRLPQSTGRKGKTFTNLFTGMATCKGCGGKMCLKNNGKVGDDLTHYFLCYNYVRGGCDRKKNFRYEEWEACILDNIREYRLSEVFTSPQQNARLQELREQIATTETRIADLDRRVSNLRLSLETADPETMAGTNNTIKERLGQRAAEERALGLLRNDEASMTLQEQSARFVEEDIAAMRAEWNTKDIPTRYKLRQRCHTALKSFIDVIQFNSEDHSVLVGLLGGARIYKFKDFELVGSFDAMDAMINEREGSMLPQHFVGEDPARNKLFERMQG